MASKHVLWRLALPIYAAGFLCHVTILVCRLATTYRAIDAGLSSVEIGILTGVFALLPVLLTVQIGRANDRSGFTNGVGFGAALVVVAAGLLWALPDVAVLYISTAILGVGHTITVSALQAGIPRTSTSIHRDDILGTFLLAASLGQVVAPMVVIVLATDDAAALANGLAWVGIAGAVLLLCAGVVLRLNGRPHRPPGNGQGASLAEIWRTPGLAWLIAAGTLVTAVQDLLPAFLPLLGIERAIAPGIIGIALSVRAGGAMVSRIIFSRAVRRWGRSAVLIAGMVLSAMGLVGVVVPGPDWMMVVGTGLVGFGLALAITAGVSLTMNIAAPGARATTFSLWLTAVRLGQFGGPLAAGVAAALFGVPAIFAASAAVLAGTCLTMPKLFRKKAGRRT